MQHYSGAQAAGRPPTASSLPLARLTNDLEARVGVEHEPGTRKRTSS